MLNTETLFSPNIDVAVPNRSGRFHGELKSLLERTYGVSFTVFDGESGEMRHRASDQPRRDWGRYAELCREVARRGRPEFLDDEDPLLTLALPLSDMTGDSSVAVATFLRRQVDPNENLSLQAELLGVNRDELLAWALRQTPWSPETLKHVSDLVLDNVRSQRQFQELQRETTSLSVNLAATYEEISLLYRLTQNLKLSRSNEELGRIALEWMSEVVPAAGLMIQLAPTVDADKTPGHGTHKGPLLLCQGDCPIDDDEFSGLIAHVGASSRHQPTVVNRQTTDQVDWPYPQIREMIVVALAEGETTFGWMAAINHVEGGEFGTVEASLLSSVAAILGIHAGNTELYRQQSELLAGVVRALTSAIDAKDRYTCGHSDRVARVAVRLAEELGCDTKLLNTLYLAGLLHDIGKIGIEDAVLRKTGKLSDEEYERIKQHVDIGYHILHDLAKLEDVLPIVLHHHESWDGRGYPHRLDSQRIPFAARIVAVADAFDAMSSDRPYRKGMPDERVDQILREGAGQQWDPEVIGAFFRARDDIRRISHGEDQPQDQPAASLA